MGLNAKEKPGYDAGLRPEAQKRGAPESYDSEFRYRALPADRDQVAWSDPSNFDHNIAHRVPMDGLDATVECLFHGKVRVDMNGDSNG